MSQSDLERQKHETGAKHGITCNRCQARGNMKPVLSAAKCATRAKRGKASRSQVTGSPGFASYWLKISVLIGQRKLHESLNQS